MSKIKTNPVIFSVSLGRFRIYPLDKKVCGNIILSPSTRSFYVLTPLDKFDISAPLVLPRGCMWSRCVRASFTCSRCEYNLVIL